MENYFKNCSCNHTRETDIHSNSQVLFPANYSYILCTNEDPTKPTISYFHFNCFSTEEIHQWLAQFSYINEIKFSIEESVTIFDHQIELKCLCKNSESEVCQTRLKIILLSDVFSENQNFFSQYPAYAILHYTHSKIPIQNLEYSLQEYAEKKLFELFENGLTPHEIYNSHKKEIRSIFDKESNNANSVQCELKWIDQQYYTYFENKYGVKMKTIRPKEKFKTQSNELQNVINSMNQPNSMVGLLNQKINELCQRYVPILPARQKNNIPNVFNAENVSNSYIIKFSEEKTDKLNLFPLKLVPTTFTTETQDYVVQRLKIPQLKITQTANDYNQHTLEVINNNDSVSQNINIPSGVDGIVILTDEHKNSNNDVKKANSKRHKRKSNLICNNADEFLFTENIEDLEDHVQVTENVRKKRVKEKRVMKKIVLPYALDGIENVICSE